jgi:hypothetical protein
MCRKYASSQDRDVFLHFSRTCRESLVALLRVTLQDYGQKPGKGSCQQVLKGDMSQVHIQAPLLLNHTKECGGPSAIFFAVEGTLVKLFYRLLIVLWRMDIPTKEHYLVLDISFVVYVSITDVRVLDTCCISVRATFILGDIEEVAAMLVGGRLI